MSRGKSAMAMAMLLMSMTSEVVTAEMGSQGSPSVLYSFGRHLLTSLVCRRFLFLVGFVFVNLQFQIRVLNKAFPSQHGSCKTAQSNLGSSYSPHRRSTGRQRAPQGVHIQVTMEALPANITPLLLTNLGPQERCLLLRFRKEGVLDCRGEVLSVQFSVMDRFRAGPRPSDHGTPERLVTKEGHHDGGFPGVDSGSSCAGAPMVDDTRYVLEEPVVRAVANHVYPGWNADVVCSQAAPAFGDEGSHSSDVDGVEDKSRQGIGIINNDGTEADIDWGFSFV